MIKTKKALISIMLIFAIIFPVFLSCNELLGDDELDGDVILDWGTGFTTDEFPTNTTYPGRSINLNDPQIIKTGVLREMSNYSKVIVDAVVYDRTGDSRTNILTGSPFGNPFFILIDNNSDWGSEVVKMFNMNVNGETEVTPETAATWNESKIPTWIAFLGQYDSAEPLNRTVGSVNIRKITFIAKEK
jgi:hypothetical protein